MGKLTGFHQSAKKSAGAAENHPLALPLCITLPKACSSYMPARFPSPADEQIKGYLDLNEHLIKRPASTFFFRMRSDSMKEMGIYPGSILVVDRSLKARNGRVVIVEYENELLARHFHQDASKITLLSSRDKLCFSISEEAWQQPLVWGVVTAVIRAL